MKPRAGMRQKPAPGRRAPPGVLDFRPRSAPFARAGRLARAPAPSLECAPGAGVAQLVEHVIRNDGVVGSIPISGTTFLIRAVLRSRAAHVMPAYFFFAALPSTSTGSAR